jgi:hypothetical protein
MALSGVPHLASYRDTLALEFDFSYGAIMALAVQTSALILSAVQFEGRSVTRASPLEAAEKATFQYRPDGARADTFLGANLAISRAPRFKRATEMFDRKSVHER